jgi:hypothetical protein
LNEALGGLGCYVMSLVKSVPAAQGLGLFDPENESCTLQTSVTSFHTTRRDMSEDLNFYLI